MAHERKCIVCGTEYRYCNHCKEFDSTETWRFIYCSGKCRKIDGIFNDYRANKISASNAISELSMNGYEDLKLTDRLNGYVNEMKGVEIVPQIEKIVEEIETPEIKEVIETISETEEEPGVVEEEPSSFSFSNKKRNKRNKYGFSNNVNEDLENSEESF